MLGEIFYTCGQLLRRDARWEYDVGLLQVQSSGSLAANFGKLLPLSGQGGPFSDYVWFQCRIEVHPSESCNTSGANHPLESEGHPIDNLKAFVKQNKIITYMML